MPGVKVVEGPTQTHDICLRYLVGVVFLVQTLKCFKRIVCFLFAAR